MICCANPEGHSTPPRPARCWAPFPLILLAVGSLFVGVHHLEAAGRKTRPAAELTNLFLGPKYARWLIGPIARIASEEEIQNYLALQDDEAAARFISDFWQRYNPDPGQARNKLRELFDERAAEADMKFREGVYLGRHTDRGTIYVLYGAAEEVTYEEYLDVAGPDVELWEYPKRAEAGLDGQRPERRYRFAKQGDLTRFYQPRRRRGHPESRPRTTGPEGPPGFPTGPPR